VTPRPFLPALLALSALAGCGEDEPIRFTEQDAAMSDVPAADVDDVMTGFEAPPPLDVRPVDGDTPGTVLVYAHSDDTLYTVDPTSRMVQRIGMFQFPMDGNMHSMTDLAVDAMGRITGVTEDALYTIDPLTARCTLIRALPVADRRVFVGLTWLPAGVLDAGAEVLLGGATDGSLWRINATTGQTARVGMLPSGWGISGDLVSIRGAATYATVRRTTGTSTTDTLVTLTFGSSVQMRTIGEVGFRSLYGLGYWRQTLYGFTRAGELISIAASTGRGTRVSMPAMQFSGAGVTTVASIAPP
jgi:predicted small lipoprotein YifL